MTPAEREKMYIANCKICLIAEALRACQVCQFRIGLQAKEQEAQVKTPVFSNHK